jgi:hypothetical protein
VLISSCPANFSRLCSVERRPEYGSPAYYRSQSGAHLNVRACIACLSQSVKLKRVSRDDSIQRLSLITLERELV